MSDIRPARMEDAKQIALLQISSWRQAYKDIVPARYLDEMHTESFIQKWQGFLANEDPDIRFYVAMVEDAVVGFINTGPARDEDVDFMYELRSIYLHPSYWGQGIGKALFEHCCAILKDQGVTSLYVWVLKDNPIGRKFYEKMGGTEVPGLTKTTGVRDVSLQEMVYGWPDLSF